MVCRSFLPSLLLAFTLFPCALLSQPATLPQRSAPAVAGAQQRFVCNTGYSQERCREQMKVLREVIGRYHGEALGEWTWVLVRSGDWKEIKSRLGLDPGSPAFSVLKVRQTFVEEALVAPVPGRSAELMKHWSSSIDELLQLAVTHEMGHALCNEEDEHRADGNGRVPRAGGKVQCR